VRNGRPAVVSRVFANRLRYPAGIASIPQTPFIVVHGVAAQQRSQLILKGRLTFPRSLEPIAELAAKERNERKDPENKAFLCDLCVLSRLCPTSAIASLIS
jgi:hypothetical protein